MSICWRHFPAELLEEQFFHGSVTIALKSNVSQNNYAPTLRFDEWATAVKVDLGGILATMQPGLMLKLDTQNKDLQEGAAARKR